MDTADNNHEEFLKGFGDAIGVSNLSSIQFHYARFLERLGLSQAEQADMEQPGYQAGLEAGAWYDREFRD
jgi:hypothetical protein